MFKLYIVRTVCTICLSCRHMTCLNGRKNNTLSAKLINKEYCSYKLNFWGKVLWCNKPGTLMYSQSSNHEYKFV